MTVMSDPGSSFPIPPPTFDFLVASLGMQAQAHLGLYHFGEEKPPEPDLAMARHAIDLLAMLAEKTKGNLTIEEERELQNTLTELRFRYVQTAERVAAEKKPAEEQPASPEPPLSGSGDAAGTDEKAGA
jgi:hypothetical protein